MIQLSLSSKPQHTTEWKIVWWGRRGWRYHLVFFWQLKNLIFSLASAWWWLRLPSGGQLQSYPMWIDWLISHQEKEEEKCGSVPPSDWLDTQPTRWRKDLQRKHSILIICVWNTLLVHTSPPKSLIIYLFIAGEEAVARCGFGLKKGSGQQNLVKGRTTTIFSA